MQSDEEEPPVCRLSHPAHPHTLSRRTGKNPPSGCFACGEEKIAATFYYLCTTCDVEFHNHCHRWPRKMIHPFHPQHPLIFSVLNHETGIIYDCNLDNFMEVFTADSGIPDQVWDGSELEWEPEEFVETEEDVAPFKKVGDDLIKHSCHEHHLRLDKYNGVRDAEKQCQACTLHIDSRDFYNCVQCDYFLHEVCANLPRKLDHALHNHPLVLDPSPHQEHLHRFTKCLVCSRRFTGFTYKCCKDGCEDESDKEFRVDVRCILVPDYFTHKSHEHPLFIPISTGEAMIFCEGCKGRSACYHLQCTSCDFAICYECATIPDKLHNKYDVHQPLSLCYGEVSDETYWCEVCEENLDQRKWFYTSNKPCITIHRSCVFGPSAYVKPGYTFQSFFFSAEVVSNTSNTRPTCCHCGCRCSSSVYFEVSTETHICSLSCLLGES
ncbi:hypothetical protein EUTSA_v10022693mg [Eutrema salsugineum]|uniref:B box-type domain-containing protein n=1 Tax=Eutrema salsugineum TaxID=72664 RepID=V4LJL0_EUTSA|nr:uncharacterized protein LOC18026265 [Eutrema salsugineum]ESQ50730.1 hypothetical protein EUTSA_v10022693mg [Eutrema salsugineum]